MRAYPVIHVCLMSYLIFFTNAGIGATRPEVMLDSDPLINTICAASASDVVITGKVNAALLEDDQTSIFLYQAGFNALTKSGVLQKTRINLIDTKPLASIAWNAADLIREDGRKIYTSRVDEDGVLTTIPFSWERLSQRQRNDLNRSPVTHKDDQRGQHRLAYLRGARDLEQPAGANSFRKRSSLLGAIVHSAPVYLEAEPSSSLEGLHSNASTRSKPAIFVGANDGALHAFSSDSGEELFAYLPNLLFSKLSSLTERGSPYRPAMDGRLVIGEIKIAKHQRTVLVAGLGGGAQGVFALDVSNPAKFDQGDGVLWEFSDGDDPDIGNVMATPIIAKFQVDKQNAAGIKSASYRYFAVVAGGLNSYQIDEHQRNRHAAPNHLFFLALDKPKYEAWLKGVNYFKIVLPSGIANLANGLTGVTTALNKVGAVRYLYLTDLQGNLWRIDVLKNAPWNDAVKKIRYKPIFTAKDNDGYPQAISQAPVVLFARQGYLILFGTGKYLERADTSPLAYKTQSFYGVIDTLNDKIPTIFRNQLAPRKLSATARSDRTLELRGRTTETTDKGWYLDFLDSELSGERSISAATVADGTLFFNTLIPAISACSKNHSRAYVLNALTGLPSSAMLKADQNLTGVLSADGIWPAPIILQTSSLPANESGSTRRYRIRKRIVQLEPDGTDEVNPADQQSGPLMAPIESTLSGGRLSWHEIINWRELRQATRSVQ